jgi:single-stranded-DNA-specific exonuclease
MTTLGSVRELVGKHYRWRLAPRVPTSELGELAALEPLLAQLLWCRGLRDAESANHFLDPTAGALGNPSRMAGLVEAVERLAQALDGDELIAIYGDYDADGLTATALLSTTLRRLGGRVLAFVPHRDRDGYGLRDGPLDTLRAAGVSLVVTVDCGVTAAAEVGRARANGLDVIVTDHHQLAGPLPDAPVLNPHRPDCLYPFADLAGVGVAFRLAEALLRERLPSADADNATAELLDLVAIGTLGDLVPLRAENRLLSRRGLTQLRVTNRPGLRALAAVAGLELPTIDATGVTFGLVPRLNAAGRLDDARLALDLLVADTDATAVELAAQLDALNRSRRNLTRKALAELQAILAEREPGAAIVFAGEVPVGIAGLLAGRLAEQYKRPALILQRGAVFSTGSIRTVPGVDAVGLLTAAADLLERFGGHAGAAGLTVRTERLTALDQRLQAAAQAALRDAAPAVLEIDAELGPATAARWPWLPHLERLEPFGPGNDAPVLLTRSLTVTELREGRPELARLALRGPGALVRAVLFGPLPRPSRGQKVDLVYRFRRDRWRGELKIELEVLDWRSSDD